MIIAQISDTHISLDTPDAAERTRDLGRTLADINALDPPADVIIHTGDIVQSGKPEEYALAAATLATARSPVHVAAGNKDHRENLRRAFGPVACPAGDAEFIDYAIEGYPARLIALDTLSSRSNKGDFCPERARRLLELIDAERSRPIAVFMHHPPFVVPVGPDPIHFETPEAMSRLQQALQHSGRVVAIFTGHVHRSTAGHVGNIPVKVTPSIATALRKGDYPAYLKRRPVYQLHRFDDDGGFVTQTRIVGAAA